MLWLLMSGKITEAAMMPAAPIAEPMILLGVGAFACNLWQRA